MRYLLKQPRANAAHEMCCTLGEWGCCRHISTVDFTKSTTLKGKQKMKRALTTTTSSLLGRLAYTQPSLQSLAQMQWAQMLMTVRSTRKPSRRWVMAVATCLLATVALQSCPVSLSLN